MQTENPDFTPKRARLSLSVGEKVRHLKHVSEFTNEAMADFVAGAGVEEIGEWLAAAAAGQETGLIHACIGCLEKLPMTIEALQRTKIGKTVNDSLKSCNNQVAVERARKLITTWKSLVASPEGPRSDKVPKDKLKKQKRKPEPEAQPEPVVESQIQLAEEVVELDETDSGAADALASLLESLPEIEALPEQPAASSRRRGIVWRSDAELVQMVEFAITETCLDLRRRIDETHGGLNQLHPHGVDTAEELTRFKESRRKERAMGGNRLREHFATDDEDDDIEETVRYAWPIKCRVLVADAIRDPKKLQSYERQDLADMHGSRLEVVYARIADIPDTPSEPSVGAYKVQANVTLEIPVKGFEELIDLDAGTTTQQQVEVLAPPTPSPPGASFEDEFVKLDSDLQTAILGSEELLNMFTKEPVLLRSLTKERLDMILSEFRHAPPPQNVQPTVPPFIEDRKSWGAATIRSSVRSQVMQSFAGPEHVPDNFQARPHYQQQPRQFLGQPFDRKPNHFQADNVPYGGKPAMHTHQAYSGPPPPGGPYFPSHAPQPYAPQPYAQPPYAQPQHAPPMGAPGTFYGGPPSGSPRGQDPYPFPPYGHPPHGGPAYGGPPHVGQQHGVPPHGVPPHGVPSHVRQPHRGPNGGPPSQFPYGGAPRSGPPPRGYSREYERR